MALGLIATQIFAISTLQTSIMFATVITTRLNISFIVQDTTVTEFA